MIGRSKATVEVGMKSARVVASERFLVLLLAGCANLPPDEACRAGLEKEYEVFDAYGHTRLYHRSPDFAVLLTEAKINEQDGDYQGCLDNLGMVSQNSYGHGPGNFSTHKEKRRIDSRNGLNRGPRN